MQILAPVQAHLSLYQVAAWLSASVHESATPDLGAGCVRYLK